MFSCMKNDTLNLVFKYLNNYNIDERITPNYKEYIIENLTAMQKFNFGYTVAPKYIDILKCVIDCDYIYVKDVSGQNILILAYYGDKPVDINFNETYFIESGDSNFVKFKDKMNSLFCNEMIIPDTSTIKENFNVEYSVLNHKGQVINKNYNIYIPLCTFDFKSELVKEEWLKSFYFTYYLLYKDDLSMLDNYRDCTIKFLINEIHTQDTQSNNNDTVKPLKMFD